MIKKSAGMVRQTIVVFIFINFLLGQLFAQPQNARFRNITSDNGLPSLRVTDIKQDAFGFIWIATWQGDYRYDGIQFKKIRSSNDGRFLTADNKGGVWISFSSEIGYYDPYTDSITRYKIPKSFGRYKIAIDDAGNVWAARGSVIIKFDRREKKFKEEKVLPHGNIGNFTAGGNGELLFLIHDKKQSLIVQRDASGKYTYETFPTDLNSPEKGKSFYPADSTSESAENGVSILKIDSAKILIINKYGWATKNRKEKTWDFKKPLIPYFFLNAAGAITDKRGNLWLSQRNSINKININSGNVTVYKSDPNKPNSLLSGGKKFIDRQGVLWIASFTKGISCLNLFDNDFGLLEDSTGSVVNDVLSALEFNDGSYWIGSRSEKYGLSHYNAYGKIIKRHISKFSDVPTGKTISTELSHPFAWGLVKSSDGSVWVNTGSPSPQGKSYGGLNRIRPGSDQITRFKHDVTDSSSLISDWILGSSFVDGSDRLWFLHKDSIGFMDPATEKFTNGIKIDADSKQKFKMYFPELITSSGDLLLLNVLTQKHYLIDHISLAVIPFANSITSVDDLRFVHQDDAKRIWFVSQKGFGYLNAANTAVVRLYEFDKLNFPIEDRPNIFNSDKQGNIWIATDNGLIQFDPVTENFKHYGYERGLQGKYFEFLNYKGPSGKLYFSGAGGINIFDPSSIQFNPYPPEMVFTGLKLDDELIMEGKKSAIQKPIVVADRITVGPEVDVIAINFAALHFAGNNNRFQYKLEGFDKNWRDGGTIGNATFTNLSPGTYTLYIKGSNLDGVWSDGKKSIIIQILPPWWRTWWAYTLYVLILLFLLRQMHLYQQARTIRKERERMQQKELDQAKEIEKAYHELKATQQQLIQSEKMASLGELTAGIAHEIQNPLNFVNNFSEVSNELISEMVEEVDKGNTAEVKEIAKDVQQNLEKILHHGKRADAIVKGMLQHSRSSSGVKEPTDINALCDEYLRLAYHGLRAKDKSFNATMKTDFDETIGSINIIPQDIGRVILNLITNAFYVVAPPPPQGGISDPDKNKNPTVWISTKKVGDKVFISVQDNGPGIPQKILDKIFQPFFTTKPTGQGTGLGLSLSYDIVKAHGGEIKVITKENEGTEFIIQLPIN